MKSKDRLVRELFDRSNGNVILTSAHGSCRRPDVAIKAGDLATLETYPQTAVPVFVGHFWLTDTPMPLTTNVACTDFCVAIRHFALL